MDAFPGNNQIISKSERRWVWFFAAVVMATTLLPYLIAFSRQGADWRFTGFLFGAEDGNSYIAKMLSGANGSWLYRTPYTAYQQSGFILHFPFFLLGKLAAQPANHEQLTALYTLYRMAAGLLMIFATYDFIAIFLKDVLWRRWATVLAILGGGLGWISLAGLQDWFMWGVPLEFYSPESFGFLSTYGLPHMATARALLLWGLRDFLVYSTALPFTKIWPRMLGIWIGLWLFQPIAMVVGVIVISIFLAVTWLRQMLEQQRQNPNPWPEWRNYFFRGVQIIGISAPFVIYTFLSFKLDPALKVWESQSVIASPPPFDYLVGYGIVLPLALLGIRPLVRDLPWRGPLLAGWILAAPLLAYAPFSSQRRLLEGIWVAMCILAVAWVATTSQQARKLATRWLLLAFPTTLILFAAGTMFSMNPQTPLYRPSDEVAAFKYLSREAHHGDVVIASYETSNPLPAWAPVRTLIGHGPESVNGEALQARVQCFYSDCNDLDRLALIDEFSVRYIIWGPNEQNMGRWDPRMHSYLQPVYASGNYAVFQVKPRSQP